jgi:hypothetical protein
MWTPEAIRQVQEAQQMFMYQGYWYGVKTSLASALPLFLFAWIQNNFNYFFTPFFMLFFEGFLGGRPIGLLLTYFSPPTWLTLGYKIGGFMPTDCVTSQLVEGRGSLAVPCQALHLKTWLLSVAGLGDGQSHVRFDPLWLVHLAYFLVMLYEIIAVSFLPRAIDRRIEREEQKKQREDEEKGGKDEKEQSRTEWEIERGVAGGVDAWKAREKAHMDEEQLLD